jgi:hypothetical protein
MERGEEANRSVRLEVWRRTVIPTAQVLCDILNDPAIPAEAKPRWAENAVVASQEEGA